MSSVGVWEMRVHELAKELGVTSKQLLADLRELGEYVRGASSLLQPEVVTRVRGWYASKAPLVERKSSDGLKRRSASSPSAGLPLLNQAWQAGAVPRPNHPDLEVNIEKLGRRFPIFIDHLSAFRRLHSQAVYAGQCKMRGFQDCGVSHIRLSGAIEQGFGFTREVALFYSPHADLQSRTFEAAFREVQNSTRSVTPDVVMISAPDVRLRQKIVDWSSPSKLGIPLILDPDDPFSLISLLREHIYARDLFYATTPVEGANFFGRRTLMQALREDVADQRVTGIFGLRKSGKTSILRQLMREVAPEGVVPVLLDLESYPSPPEDPTDDLISDIRRRLRDELKVRGLRTKELAELPARASVVELKNALISLLRNLERDGGKVLLLLDEIEYLTPGDQIDIAEGPMPRIAQLLGALRSVVQESSNFTFLLSGLTSAIVESGRLYGRPNPLFSWARPIYVSPLSREEADDLAITVGGKMGIEFDSAALEAIYEASGGHAFLYRSLCSQIVRDLPVDVFKRQLSRSSVLEALGEWRAVVYGNIEEMMAHVQRYYGIEAILLELLMESPSEFDSLAETERVATRRLVDLGLISRTEDGFQPSVVLELL